MFHISDLKKYNNCPKQYYLSKEDSIPFMQYLRNDASMVNLLSEYFNIDKYFSGERGDPPQRFIDNINNYEWFFNVRIEDDKLRVKIPLIQRVENEFILYFTLFKVNVKEVDLYSYRLTSEVFNSLGYKIKEIKIIYLNSDYIFHDHLEVNELFKVISEDDGVSYLDKVLEKYIDYKELIEEIENNNVDTVETKRNKSCRLFGTCVYYDDCFPYEKELPDDSILTLVSSKNKNLMFENGIRLLKDADTNLIEGNKVQYSQIMASRNGGLFVDKNLLKKWLNSFISDSISFIDFEWDRYLIPVYEGMKPFDVVCFEFALYYLNEKGSLEHRTFIGTNDCRKEFVEALIKYLPKEGPIIAYNADGAEVLRIKELADIYPEYKKELDDIASRFIDLAIPFVEGMVYDIRMKGNYSVKQILSVISDYSYKGLNVSDGMKAVYSWRDVDKGISETPEQVIEDLSVYCSLDAYSLFLIYKWLVELALT